MQGFPEVRSSAQGQRELPQEGRAPAAWCRPLARSTSTRPARAVPRLCKPSKPSDKPKHPGHRQQRGRGSGLPMPAGRRAALALPSPDRVQQRVPQLLLSEGFWAVPSPRKGSPFPTRPHPPYVLITRSSSNA